MSNRILLFLFGLSGMAALVYEIVWARELVLIFGASAYAVSTVLAVFFAGLALGSIIFGRLVDRYKKPLLLYALLEVGIGIYALFTPWIFELVQALQVSFGGGLFLRLIFSFAALIIPTTLIGGTLPVIIKYFNRDLLRFGSITAKLYSINTFGAVVGTILAGFFLILWLGMAGAIYFAAAINITVAGVAFFLWRKTAQKVGSTATAGQAVPALAKGGPGPPFATDAVGRGDFRLWLVLAGFFISGFAAIGLEVLWTRALILTIGISTYAFSIVLITFLLGIALGSLVVSRFIDKIDVWNAFARIEILRGASVIALIPIFGILPFWYLFIIEKFGWSFGAGISTSFIVTVAVLLVPTLLMGATFPVVAKIVTRKLNTLGFSVGRAYLFNTLGGVGGALVAGFLLIPLLGVQKSIVLMAALYILVGVALTLFSRTSARSYKAVVVVISLGFLIGGVLMPDWNRAILNSRVFTRAPAYFEQSGQSIRGELENIKLLFYRDGISSLVAVKEDRVQTVLLINGKPQSATEGDKESQLLLGHLPMLLHEDPKQALVIGFGGGMTLGAIEQYSELEKVTVVEIEAEVMEAAPYFAHSNNDALNDPRLEVVIEDGRNYLLTTDESFDVISSEPSNPWIKGLANLYTKEFFELASEHLNDGGIMVQWIQITSISNENLLSFISTFQSVFPSVSIFGANTFLILVGGEGGVDTFDTAKIDERLSQESVGRDLARIKIESASALFGYFVAPRLRSGQAVNELEDDIRLHTDDKPFLEFSSPKSFYNNLEHFLENLEFVHDIREPAKVGTTTIAGQADSAFGKKYFDARTQFIETTLLNNYASLATEFESEEDYKKAEKYYQKLVDVFPENSLAWRGLGSFYARRSLFAEAEEAFLRSLELNPNDIETHLSLGAAYRKMGDLEKAIMEYTKAFEIDPNEKRAQEAILQLER